MLALYQSNLSAIILVYFCELDQLNGFCELDHLICKWIICSVFCEPVQTGSVQIFVYWINWFIEKLRLGLRFDWFDHLLLSWYFM